VHNGQHSSPHRCRAGAYRRGCRQPARPLARPARLLSLPRRPPPRRPPPAPRRRRPPRRCACAAATRRRGSPASPPPTRRSRPCCGAHMPYAKVARLRPPRPTAPPRRPRPDRLERCRCRRPPQAAAPRTRTPQRRPQDAGHAAARAWGRDGLCCRAVSWGRLCARRRPPRSAEGAARAALSACAQNRLSWPPGRAAQLRRRLLAGSAEQHSGQPRCKTSACCSCRTARKQTNACTPAVKLPPAQRPACAASPSPAATSRGCSVGGARRRSALRTCAGSVCSREFMMRRTSCWHPSAQQRRAPHPPASGTPPTRAAGAPADKRISPHTDKLPRYIATPEPQHGRALCSKAATCPPVLCMQRIALQRCAFRLCGSRQPRLTARLARCCATHSSCYAVGHRSSTLCAYPIYEV
jgi:hypothetical protein